ncbi:hypothetical protein BGZ60DRAFT_8157 [Tricladium varicosporioides]|nr:hypothetical protein BGZ60DRAFT_8157 [Hymenoscyphus varicosporioides]
MGPTNAKSTFAEDLGTTVITIYAGPERKSFVVHKSLLTSQSSYFDKALNGNFKEADENSITLEEEDPAAVGLLIGWLYRGIIPGTRQKISPFARRSSDAGFQEYVAPPPYPDNGTSLPFTPGTYSDPNNPRMSDTFTHIGFDAQYQQWSPEELRLADYKLNRIYGPAPLAHGAAAANPAPATVPMTLTTGQPGTVPPYQPVSLFGPSPWPAAPRPGGLFGGFGNGTQQNSLFGRPPNRDARSGPFSFKNKPTLQPGEFGFDPLIKYPKTEQVFLQGISRSDALDTLQEEQELQQFALLNLCILAETICWTYLFNDAVDAYVSGELNLHRNIPFEHVELIYQRTYSESPLREFVMDSIRRLNTNNANSHLEYMPLAQQYEGFLEDVLGNLSGLKFVNKAPLFPPTPKSYHKTEDEKDSAQEVFARKEKEQDWQA